MQPPDQLHINMRGTLVHPDGKNEQVIVRMDVADMRVSYTVLTPDTVGPCPLCGRTITIKGDGRYNCPYCRAQRS